MLEELRDIERELDRMKRRIRRMIQLIEKRQVRLMQLSKEEILSEVGSRTLPATDIAELLGVADKPRKKT
jgi:uncharacterized protein Yka (UPF0111/DUF47 family)